MQVGIINEENYPQILRGISQRRRHGVLELHAGDHIFEVSFYQGKIVDVSCDKRSALRQVADRLIARGSLFEGPWLEKELSPAILLEQSQLAAFDLNEEVVAKLWEQQLLECLYSIELLSGSYYNFRVEFVSTPEQGSAQISVGQLLLDLVGYGEVHSAFTHHCSEESVLARGTPAEREYSFEENELIWLVDGEMTVGQLRTCTLLNRLTFEETLTSLMQEGILVTAEARSAAVTSSGLLDLDAALDACIDRAKDVSLVRDSPELIVREILNEKRVSSGTPSILKDSTRFSFLSGLERLSALLGASENTLEVVLCAFVLIAFVVPLVFW